MHRKRNSISDFNGFPEKPGEPMGVEIRLLALRGLAYAASISDRISSVIGDLKLAMGPISIKQEADVPSDDPYNIDVIAD